MDELCQALKRASMNGMPYLAAEVGAPTRFAAVLQERIGALDAGTMPLASEQKLLEFSKQRVDLNVKSENIEEVCKGTVQCNFSISFRTYCTLDSMSEIYLGMMLEMQYFNKRTNDYGRYSQATLGTCYPLNYMFKEYAPATQDHLTLLRLNTNLGKLCFTRAPLLRIFWKATFEVHSKALHGHMLWVWSHSCKSPGN